MMGMLGETLSGTVALAQLFPDVGGFLFSPEFLGPLASLISSLLTSLITSLLGGFLGTMM